MSAVDVDAVGSVLKDVNQPLKARFRALFILRNVGGEVAIRHICECFDDPSELLKHELAYCLGQMQDRLAVPTLITLLEDTNREPIVRHEAAEALAAIGSLECVDTVKQFVNDPEPAVAETCQLALQRLQYYADQTNAHEWKKLSKNPYNSVDPAPPMTRTEEKDVEYLNSILVDSTQPLWIRYRAMFSLRNVGTDPAIQALAKALHCPSSALFRHEIAYVLGQLQSPLAVSDLCTRLSDMQENSMVRHECAEALGAEGGSQGERVLRLFMRDQSRVVRESCVVALDMADYENSNLFQYAQLTN